MRPTKALWVFLVAAPLLGVAALNTGNNSLYLLLAITLGGFIASGWVSRHTLRSLNVRVSPPAEAFAGSPVRLDVVFENASRWLPATAVVCRLAGMRGQAFAARVSPRGQTHVTLTTVFPRRGRHPMPGAHVEVRLPFPFFVKSTRIAQQGEVMVYPRRVPAAPPRWAAGSRRELLGVAGNRMPHGEVEQLREFRPGDDRRDIHWKQTARQQRCIVMERRQSSAPSRFLVLDRELPRRDDGVLLERFEDLVSEVASAAVAQIRRGETVGLVVGGAVTPPGRGPGHVRRVLRTLAVVQAGGPGDDPLPALVATGPVYRLVEGRR